MNLYNGILTFPLIFPINGGGGKESCNKSKMASPFYKNENKWATMQHTSIIKVSHYASFSNSLRLLKFHLRTSNYSSFSDI